MLLAKNIVRLSNRSFLSNSIPLNKIYPKYFLPPKSFGHITKLFKSSKVSQRFSDSPKFKAFKEKQAKMQCDDGYPVHLKGGIIDKILYHITVGACVIGLAQCFWLFYLLATT